MRQVPIPHTPAPWRVTHADNGARIIRESAHAGEQPVAAVTSLNDAVVSDGNAAIIANAPWLYHAMRNLVVGVESGDFILTCNVKGFRGEPADLSRFKEIIAMIEAGK